MSDSLRNPYDDDPVVRSNEGLGEPFSELVERRISRRGLLAAGLALGFAASEARLLGSLFRAQGSPTGLDFEGLAADVAEDRIVVAPNYRVQTLVRWGDPLKAGVMQKAPGTLDAVYQAQAFGYNCDFVGYLPLPYGSKNSEHGLLGVNFEYVNPELMFPGFDPDAPTRSQVETCMEAVGFGVVEIEKAEGRWKVSTRSPFNKRYTATTEGRFSGPATGSDRLKTSKHQDGTTCTGTMANCSAGKTPWGTILSGEENFQDLFGNAETLKDDTEQRSAKRYGLGEKASEYRWERHVDRFDLAKEPHEANHFGWVVEIDPYDPDWTMVKRTALGRCRHEAATTHVTKAGRVVMYTGDDARFEYVYKFVCAKSFNTTDRKANRDLLDDGILYVARFNEDGSGEWLPLVFGQGPLTAANGFRSQADVVIDVRIAADLVGATKMDRPEDIEVNPVNQKVYVVCTNNVDRGTEGKDAPDRPNPRSENKHGHIIELTETGDDHAATTFRWDLFLVCGDPDDATTYYAGYPKDAVSPISCPDNIAFDMKGNLWIATDGQEKAMKRRDGFYAVPTDGPERGKLKRFLASVLGAEVCGPDFTPDGRSLFLAIQHPGEGSTFDQPSTHWPDGSGTPRPSIIVVQADDGGAIGGEGK